MGTGINRDTLKQNVEMLEIAIPHLSVRCAVATCVVHLKALYDFMRVGIPGNLMHESRNHSEAHLNLLDLNSCSAGNVVEMQGWVLRRCLSYLNRICGRPYRPRDLMVRRLCELAGCTWPAPEGRSRSSLEDEPESEGYEEEESESEAETDDAECEEPAGILCACATFCMSQVPRRS